MEIVLMLAGAAIVYYAFTKLYGRLWTRKLEADIHFSEPSAVSGDRIELVETVTNDKWMPIPFVNVKFRISRNLHFEGSDSNSNVTDKSYKNDVFSLLFHQRITRKISVMCKKRGLYCIDSIELVSKGIFMKEIMSCKKQLHEELIVYPAIADTDRVNVVSRSILGEIISRRNLYQDPFELRGIRDYSTADTMRSINWKATAKTGELKVNLYGYTSSNNICILLDLGREGMLVHEALLEESISVAAGLAQSLIARGASVSLISNGRDMITHENINIRNASGMLHIGVINTALARLDLSLEAQPFEELLDGIDEQSFCVIISSVRSKALQIKYDDMCRKGAASLWILPYYAGTTADLKLCPHAVLNAWEVAPNE